MTSSKSMHDLKDGGSKGKTSPLNKKKTTEPIADNI